MARGSIQQLGVQGTGPITFRSRLKAGMGKIEQIGESPYELSFEIMTFNPRTMIWYLCA